MPNSLVIMAQIQEKPIKPQKKGRTLVKWGIVTGIVSAFVCLIAGSLEWSGGKQALLKGNAQELINLGNYGSYLQGTTASFWALAGVCLIFVAFLGQMLQLRLQQREMEMTREDLEEQKKQLASQNESIKRQTFETSLFQLLSLQNEITQQLSIDVSRMVVAPSKPEDTFTLTGRKCFLHFYRVFRRHAESRRGSAQADSIEAQRAFMADAYLEFYNEFQAELGHYFRNLYHVFKFIAGSRNIEDTDRQEYASLARAQLSAYELVLLFYNSITPMPPGKENEFKELIERFCLLKNLDRKLLLNKAHEKFYRQSAFEQHPTPL
jgi:hypothetical protein